MRAVEEVDCIVLCQPTQWTGWGRMGGRIYKVDVGDKGRGICWPGVGREIFDFVAFKNQILQNHKK